MDGWMDWISPGGRRYRAPYGANNGLLMITIHILGPLALYVYFHTKIMPLGMSLSCRLTTGVVRKTCEKS